MAIPDEFVAAVKRWRECAAEAKLANKRSEKIQKTRAPKYLGNTIRRARSRMIT